MSQFNRLQLEVEGLVRARGTMQAATDLIYAEPGLEEDERAALWLLAWSLLPEDQQARAQTIATARLTVDA